VVCINGKTTIAVIDPIIQDCFFYFILFEDMKITAVSFVAHELVEMSKMVG